MKEIRSTSGEGMWITGHRFFYKAAHRAKADFHDSYSRYLQARQRYYQDRGPEIPWEYEDPELSEKSQRAVQDEHVTLLYCCMAVESFLNYYGVIKFGEKYFKRNLERQGIKEKVSNIVLAVSGKCIEPTDDIYKEVRTLFDARNSLVHPKTKELNSENILDHLPDSDGINEVEVHVERMDHILQLFCELDPELSWHHEFGTDESDFMSDPHEP
jgi:hypothetical protein